MKFEIPAGEEIWKAKERAVKPEKSNEDFVAAIKYTNTKPKITIREKKIYG